MKRTDRRTIDLRFRMAVGAKDAHICARDSRSLRTGRRRSCLDCTRRHWGNLTAALTAHGNIVTGVEELVLVPVPNWPQSFAPQHRTVPPPRSAQL